MNPRLPTWTRCCPAFAALAVALASYAGPANPSTGLSVEDNAETVLVTFHAAPGSEQAFLEALRAERSLLESEHYVAANTPYLLVRGTDAAGKVYFVESFTWRDASIPDHAPARLRAVWDKLNRACPSTPQHPGIEIAEVEIVATK